MKRRHQMLANTFTHRVLGKTTFGAGMLACALSGVVGQRTDAAAASVVATAPAELPSHWQGQPVRPLALSAVEQRFALAFPGHIARLTDGRQIVVLREVRQPTRMLHPAVDCFRALGYRIDGERLETLQTIDPAPAPPANPLRQTIALRVSDRLPLDEATAQEATASTVQRCFTARKDGVALRVCEQIEDAAGRRFADTSAWYWAAALGQSTGPWRAVTVTRPWHAGDA